jgi:hypothetical protein
MSEVIMSKSEKGASPTFHYFYTDPLAAAWMANHFGMRFNGWIWNDENFYFESTINADDEDDGSPYEFGGAKVYVHLASLHLLEPKAGDLLEWRCKKATPPFDYSRIDKINPGDDTKVHPDNELLQIIQRDGKPYFWPEREVV